MLLRISQTMKKLWIVKFPTLECLLAVMLAFSILGCEDGGPNIPSVTIYQPENNSSFPFGTQIHFEAVGYTVKGGIAYTVPVWTISSYPDFSYSEKTWETDTLSIGAHTITATVTNDDGVVVVDRITITITPN